MSPWETFSSLSKTSVRPRKDHFKHFKFLTLAYKVNLLKSETLPDLRELRQKVGNKILIIIIYKHVYTGSGNVSKSPPTRATPVERQGRLNGRRMVAELTNVSITCTCACVHSVHVFVMTPSLPKPYSVNAV